MSAIVPKSLPHSINTHTAHANTPHDDGPHYISHELTHINTSSSTSTSSGRLEALNDHRSTEGHSHPTTHTHERKSTHAHQHINTNHPQTPDHPRTSRQTCHVPWLGLPPRQPQPGPSPPPHGHSDWRCTVGSHHESAKPHTHTMMAHKPSSHGATHINTSCSTSTSSAPLHALHDQAA